MGFTKLDEGILKSSIMAETPATFKVWIALLASCDYDGVARVSPIFLSAACHLSQSMTDKSIDILSSPDQYSRSDADEGRRIRRVDDGYFVINYQKYRAFSYSDKSEAVRKREYRAGVRKLKNGYVYFAATKEQVKIGFSANPWARLIELKISAPGIELIGAYPGTTADERKEHERFKDLHIQREWYKRTEFLNGYVRDILGRSETEEGHSASASKSASTSFSEELKEMVSQIINYLNEKAGKKFSTKPEGTIKLIVGRLKEGRTLNDFKQVIDTKVAKWRGDPKMDDYLRPDTLFRPSNFESYLNEQPMRPPIGKNVVTPSSRDIEYKKAKAEFIKKHGDDPEKVAIFSQEWWDKSDV